PPKHRPVAAGRRRARAPPGAPGSRRIPGRGRLAGFHQHRGRARQPVAPALPLVQAPAARGRFAEHHLPRRDTPHVLLLGPAAGRKREDREPRDGAQLGRVHAFEVRVVHTELRRHGDRDGRGFGTGEL
ncbi:MAG: hypothetical protein AVDCRST_MAG86-770, partial [uncultured Truepera sp.]